MSGLRLAACAALWLLFQAPASAETRIFVVDSSDGYGIDRCLAAGESCGARAANALCRARDFARADRFGRLTEADVTGATVKQAHLEGCEGGDCLNTVAILCSR